jgi:hypothetical protein
MRGIYEETRTKAQRKDGIRGNFVSFAPLCDHKIKFYSKPNNVISNRTNMIKKFRISIKYAKSGNTHAIFYLNFFSILLKVHELV